MGKTESITEVALKRLQQTSDDLNSQGFRSLAVAYVEVAIQSHYSVADERKLTLAGFLSFADEPLRDAEETVAALKQEGSKSRSSPATTTPSQIMSCTLVTASTMRPPCGSRSRHLSA